MDKGKTLEISLLRRRRLFYQHLRKTRLRCLETVNDSFQSDLDIRYIFPTKNKVVYTLIHGELKNKNFPIATSARKSMYEQSLHSQIFDLKKNKNKKQRNEGRFVNEVTELTNARQ